MLPDALFVGIEAALSPPSVLQGKTADGPQALLRFPEPLKTCNQLRLRLISPTRCMAYALHAGRKTVIPHVHRKCRILLCKHFNCRCQSDTAYSNGHLHFFDAAPFVVLMRHVRFKLTLLSFIWLNNNNLCLICHTLLRSHRKKMQISHYVARKYRVTSADSCRLSVCDTIP